ncbi:MAG: hypothetical protein JOY92_08400 [Verrucomicrobia bacterium]|jgi:hypothetical protein|nr:hypothetical protein [Verrucomicrobiota bacterium]
MNKLVLFAGLLLTLIPAGSVSAQSTTKQHKVGALTKSLANPYFLRMKHRRRPSRGTQRRGEPARELGSQNGTRPGKYYKDE